MCGFAGFWDASGATSDPSGVTRRMTDAIRHRGPDDAGAWHDADAGVFLGHRRLSIIDLSCEGHQPMASPGGRFHLVYNGEIYNFAALRADLTAAGARFRGHSDTEVLLAAMERWGVAGAIERCAGMFALAVWDRSERALHLVRDRLGEKPLYYAVIGRQLLFGSELKALSHHPAWAPEVDRDALALYLRHNCVPAPYTIYRGVRKATPGTVITVRAAAGAFAIDERPYWNPHDVVGAAHAAPFAGSPEEAVDALGAVLGTVVREQMIADVPLGAFLSGGIDSSTVVALMQAESAQRVRTFTIGFAEGDYSEAAHARAVARHLGTDHTELTVTPADALGVIPDLPATYDEPFGDSSQIPTVLVARLARAHVTVSLSGDGGDELFAGYNRHAWGERLWRRLRPVPRAPRRLVAAGLQRIAPRHWDRTFGALGGVLPRRGRVSAAGDKVHKLARVLGAASPAAVYRELTSHWGDPAAVVIGGVEPATRLHPRPATPGALGIAEQMMYLDMLTYLPDDILVKVDRACMSVGLESRAPFLDHRVVELAWRLPLAHKLRDGVGKWVLRQLLYRSVPRELVQRPKMGFAVPLADWLRGPLREWANDLLSADRLRRDGYFHPAPVSTRWAEHLSGRRNWQHELWDVLMFQAWLDTQSPAR